MRRPPAPLRLAAAAAFAAITAAATAAPAPSPSPAYSWRNVRIDGGGFVAAVLFHPTTPGLAYARTDMGGVYRWYNATALDPGAPPDGWTPLLDDLGVGNASYLGTLALAMDPTNPDALYLACGLYTAAWAANAAVLVSGARGAPGSWTAVPLPLKLGGNEDGRSAGERLAVNPARPARLLLATSQNGLWVSDNAARNWSGAPPAGFPPGPTAELTMVSYSRDGRTAVVGVRTGTGTGAASSATLWVSTDGGDTWGVPAGAPPALAGGGPLTLTPYRVAWDADNATAYVTANTGVGPNGMANGTVWRWDGVGAGGGGGVWTDVSPAPLIARGGYAGVAADATTPGVVMVSSLDVWYPLDNIYRSTNGGANWTELGTAWGLSSPTALWIYWHGGTPTATGWMGDVAIDPFDGAHATHTTGQGLWASRDVGAAETGAPTHWAFANAGLEETAVIELVSPPPAPAGAPYPSPPLLSALGDITGFRHDDLGLSPVSGAFNPMRGTTSGLDVAWATPWVVVRSTPAGSGERHVSRATDGGYNFTDLPTEPAGAGPGPVAITADGAAIVFAGHVTRDNGSTWTPVAGMPSGARPFADRVSAAHLYAVSSNGTLWVSADVGGSFTPGATGLPSLASQLRTTPGHAGHVWLPAGSAGLLRSTDAGASVGARLPGVDVAYSVSPGAALAPGAYPAVYVHGVVGGEEGVWRSGDEGGSWARVNGWGSKYGYVEFVVGDSGVPGRVYVATNGRGIAVGDEVG